MVATAAVVAVDISVNVGLSAVLERMFPSYDMGRNVWVQAGEAGVELTLYILFAGVITRSLTDPFVEFLPGSVQFASLLFIYFLDNALLKLRALQTRLFSVHSNGPTLDAKLGGSYDDGPL